MNFYSFWLITIGFVTGFFICKAIEIARAQRALFREMETAFPQMELAIGRGAASQIKDPVKRLEVLDQLIEKEINLGRENNKKKPGNEACLAALKGLVLIRVTRSSDATIAPTGGREKDLTRR